MTTYCFDIDGTICTNTDGDYEDAEPFPEMVDALRKLHKDGHRIVMFTARGASSGIDWTDITAHQLRTWGVPYDSLVMNKKPSFDLLIDDKAMHVSEFRKKFLGKKRVGFVASTFDLLHPGYVRMFQDAKQHCDHLIAALHEDPTLERPLKNAPVQTLEERKIVLESCKYVDEVLTYVTEKDLEKILEERKPDVRILGTDWKGKRFTGDHLPIKIHWHERNHDWSTSNLRTRISVANRK